MQHRRQCGDIARGRIVGRQCPRHTLADGDAGEQDGEVGQGTGIRQPAGSQFIGHRQDFRGPARGESLQQAQQMALVDGAEHALHGIECEIAGTVGNGLIGERQGVAHGAAGRLPDEAQCMRVEGQLFLAQHRLQMLDNGVDRHVLQVELQAA